MDRITPPIFYNDRGAAVRNLQDALLLLLTVNGVAPEELRDFIDTLSAEQREDVYGSVTADGVARFQRAHKIEFDLPLDTGEQVDDPTAAAMNRRLDGLGAFARVPAQDFLVAGRVEFEDGGPAAGLRV